jgi:threonine/homoserine/homoserine lactone efflux protein
VPTSSTLLLFSAAALALLVVPGPSVLYIVGQGLRGGRRAGAVATLGVHTGSLVHVAAAVVGRSALLASSADAFSVVRIAGAAYLIVLGIRMLVSGTSGRIQAAEPARLRRVYMRGALVNTLNPKTALFFMAFLPQFVDPRRGHVPDQVAALGLTFILLGLMSDSTWAMAAGTLGPRLRAGGRLMRWQPNVSGCLFIGLGVAAAGTSGPSSRS